MTKIRKSRSGGMRSGNRSSMLKESIKNRYVRSKVNVAICTNEKFVSECRSKISEFEEIVNTRLKRFDLSNTELVNYLNIINHYKVQIFIAENNNHELTKRYLQTGYKIQEINGILHTLSGRYNDEYNDILVEINNPKQKQDPPVVQVDKFDLNTDSFDSISEIPDSEIPDSEIPDSDAEIDLLDLDAPDEIDSLISSSKINVDGNLEKMKMLIGCDYLK
jgi:hypothetical protein